MSKDNRTCLFFSVLVVESFSSWAGVTLMSFVGQNGLPKLVCLLVKKAFQNQSYLPNKGKKHLSQLFTNLNGLLEFSDDPPRDSAWAAARNTMLRAVPVPHSLQKPRHSLWSQLCSQWLPSSAGAAHGCFQPWSICHLNFAPQQWWVFSGGMPNPFGEYTSCKIGHELKFPWLNLVVCTLWELPSKCLLHLTAWIQR